MSSEAQSTEKKQLFIVRWMERIWNVKHYHIYFNDEASYNNGIASISNYIDNNNMALYYASGYSCSGNRLKKLPSGDFKPDIPKLYIYVIFGVFLLNLLSFSLVFIIVHLSSLDAVSKIYYITMEMLDDLLHFVVGALLPYFLFLIYAYLRARKSSSSGKVIVLSIIILQNLKMIEFLQKENFDYEIYSV